MIMPRETRSKVSKKCQKSSLIKVFYITWTIKAFQQFELSFWNILSQFESISASNFYNPEPYDSKYMTNYQDACGELVMLLCSLDWVKKIIKKKVLTTLDLEIWDHSIINWVVTWAFKTLFTNLSRFIVDLS